MSDRSAAINSDASDAGASICIGCALCCNGTLFARAKIKDETEDRHLSALGFTLLEVDGQRHFKQPCSYEKNCSCSIYESRPDVCRAFRCALLKRHEAGEIDTASALEKISKARALRAAVADLDPEAADDGPRQVIQNRLAEQLQSATAENRQLIARRLLNIVALETYLDRWFRKKKTGAVSDQAALPAD